mgnify:CR=1 FL=1
MPIIDDTLKYESKDEKKGYVLGDGSDVAAVDIQSHTKKMGKSWAKIKLWLKQLSYRVITVIMQNREIIMDGLAVMWFIFSMVGVVALAQLEKLTKPPKNKGTLDEDYKEEWEPTFQGQAPKCYALWIVNRKLLTSINTR